MTKLYIQIITSKIGNIGNSKLPEKILIYAEKGDTSSALNELKAFVNKHYESLKLETDQFKRDVDSMSESDMGRILDDPESSII